MSGAEATTDGVTPSDRSEAIRVEARRLGFDAVGVTDADAIPDARARLDAYIALGRHGGMDWLARDPDRRGSPRGLWPDARSVVAVALNYGPAGDPMALLDHPDRGIVSVYARNRDYHDILKRRLKELARWMVGRFGGELKVFVDTAPVMEKPLAAAAGLGWQGKHSNLLSREHGSWLFLGTLYTSLELAPDQPSDGHCGSCRACLDICPTKAFPAPFQVDARRCISYLTIEHKGHIEVEFRAAMGNRIYGCDDCLAVCPWNKFARSTKEPGFLPRAELTAPRLRDLAELDDASFRALFAGSPIKRTGRDRFVRNVLIALGNSGDIDAVPLLERLTGDASPLVRAMAVWALSRLLPADAFAARRDDLMVRETDPEVRREWRDG
ncbi:tRNA epoxyqueuosine(34) reductase QueG [Oceanibacterium hippocampi]|uniref:Epoxyqueuosine reductase n=1 Tax=Oceanibacterium hippocampi TaxID=745714 RepID=A0A1Y5RV66_9PROT|nr:tRNA epoxyqueuosine(34) reductase QueG [Oceanibacterium hippocampi]SLN23481.1 Epoxyqueuosine reductase [Oceanibacterium hippocampi]